MKKSGLADSPFFTRPAEKASTPLPSKDKPGKKEAQKKEVKENKKKKVAQEEKRPRNHDTIQPSNHGTVVSRYHDTIIEFVRKAVKEVGKEAATHRFTVEEKKEIIDLIYAYKRQGMGTSENEITRIAVNFLIQDHKENGENSILHKVLQALNE